MKIKKTLLYSLLFLIASLQCLFLGSIIYEQHNEFYVIPFIFLFIFLIASFFHSYIKEYHIEYDSWKSAIWIFSGTIGTWFLRTEFNLDAVFATALIGTIASSLQMLFKNNKYLAQIAAPIYCGAFIAMSNLEKDLTFIIIAASFSFILLIMSKTILNGIGGKLGTIAFNGVVLAYLFYLLIH
jgi:hypothetical protein